MPTWILFAILAPAIATLVAFIDKFNLTSQIKDYRGMALFSAVISLIVGGVAFIATGFPSLGFYNSLLVMGTGILSIFGAALYFWLMSIEDASTVVFFLQTIPVFTMIMSFFFLGEKLSPTQLLGFILILGPTLLLTKTGETKKRLQKTALTLIITSNILFAASGVLYKFIVDQISFSQTIAFESFGWAFGGLFLFLSIPAVRNGFINTIKELPKTAILFLFFNELLYVISKFCSFYATSLGPVSLVSVISGIQVFFGIILGVVFTKFLPKYFNEQTDIKSLAYKFVLFLVTMGGMALIS